MASIDLTAFYKKPETPVYNVNIPISIETYDNVQKLMKLPTSDKSMAQSNWLTQWIDSKLKKNNNSRSRAFFNEFMFKYGNIVVEKIKTMHPIDRDNAEDSVKSILETFAKSMFSHPQVSPQQFHQIAKHEFDSLAFENSSISRMTPTFQLSEQHMLQIKEEIFKVLESIDVKRNRIEKKLIQDGEFDSDIKGKELFSQNYQQSFGFGKFSGSNLFETKLYPGSQNDEFHKFAMIARQRKFTPDEEEEIEKSKTKVDSITNRPLGVVPFFPYENNQ